ncbi:MAG: CaiB/BaiF CoA transferase family protein [Candidatus Binatia bacterium]
MTDREHFVSKANENQALSGLRVLELADCEGEYCGKLLADLGAEVIKVESPGGSLCRREPPFKDDIPGPDRSLHFLYFNSNKKGITLDLGRADGRAIFRELIKRADVVTESFEPGYLAGLGLGYEDLKKVNPALILASITCFGQAGPYSRYKGTDLAAFALGGLMYVSGKPSGPPVNAPEKQAFLVGSTHGALAILIALWTKRDGGTGQHIDISIMDCLASMENLLSGKRAEGDYPRRSGSQHRFAAPGTIYPCRDGFVHIFVTNSQVGSWNRFLNWMGRPKELAGPEWEDSIYRRQHVEQINKVVSEHLKNFRKEEIYEQLQERHVPCASVNSPADFVDDPHTRAREYIVGVSHPFLGEFRFPGPPYKMSGSPWKFCAPAPSLGQHNEEIYCSLALTQQALTSLYAAKVI